MKTDIAAKLARTVIEVLRDVPPLVLSKDAPLASALTSRKLKPARDYTRYGTNEEGCA